MSRIIILAAATLLLIALAAATLVSPPEPPTGTQEEAVGDNSSPESPGPTVITTTPLQGDSRAAAYQPPEYGDWGLVGYSSAKVALSLAAKLYDGGNLAFSPLSIAAALTMVYDCSLGETRLELARLLGLPLDVATVREGYSRTMPEVLAQAGVGYNVSLATSIWIDELLDPNPACAGAAETYYRAAILQASFSRDPEAARAMVNEWISKETSGLIREAIPRGGVSRETGAIVVSALYFKSPWEEPFEPVEGMRFHTPQGTVEVRGLGDTRSMRYYEDQDLKAVLIPYKAPGYSMLVLLPVNGSIEDLLGSLDHARLDEILANADTATVKLLMPEIDVTTSMELSSTLKEMGVKRLFTPNPELRIARDTQLMADSIYHNTRIKVNWLGTEAAASTAIVFLQSAVLGEKEMIVDRPFIFMIIHEETRAILFMGIVVDPSTG